MMTGFYSVIYSVIKESVKIIFFEKSDTYNSHMCNGFYGYASVALYELHMCCLFQNIIHSLLVKGYKSHYTHTHTYPN